MSLASLLTERASQFAHGQFEDSQCLPQFASQNISSEEMYVEVWLRRMWIVNVRSLWKKYYASVYSEARTANAEFKQMITPSRSKMYLRLSWTRLSSKNQLLMGPCPYPGGAINVDIALLAIRSGDYSGPFLEVLSDLGSAAGVPYVGMAQPFLKPLAKGIDLFTGDSSNTNFGWRTALPGRTGVYALEARRNRLPTQNQPTERNPQTVAASNPVPAIHPIDRLQKAAR